MSRRSLVPRADRVTINHEFRSIEQFVAEYVTNISRSGVFIRSADPLPVGTRVDLRFSVIVDDVETIEGIGEVVRVTERPRGMGVVFTQLTAHSRDLISKLITRQRRGVAAGPASVPAKGAGKGGGRR